MDRDLLAHLPIVVAVARHGAFAAAAAELGMSPSAVSHAVRSVEDRVGSLLFARTTRSVSLTEAGGRFVAGVEPALTDIVQTVDGLTEERGEVTGLLRIDSPALRVRDRADTNPCKACPRAPAAKRRGQNRPNARGHRCSRLRRRHQKSQVDPSRYGYDAVDWTNEGYSRRVSGLSSCQRRARVDRRLTST